jgi:hypothetical protein
MLAAQKALRVIDSCETEEQLLVAARMAGRVIAMYIHRPGYWACAITMDDRIRRKAYELTTGRRLLEQFMTALRGSGND